MLFLQARVRNPQGCLIQEVVYTVVHFERTTAEYNLIFDELNTIHQQETGSELFCEILSSDSESALVSSLTQKIGSVYLKNCC